MLDSTATAYHREEQHIAVEQGPEPEGQVDRQPRLKTATRPPVPTC